MLMLRSLSLAAAAALAVGADEFSYFCQVQCGDQLLNSCETIATCNVTEGCSLVAMQTLTSNDGVCEAFMKSGPVCSSKPPPGFCFEAIDFQLIWNREKDAKQCWTDQSSHGLSLMFHDAAAIFAPGHGSFAFRSDVMAAADAMLYKTSGALDMELHQVLTEGLNGPEADRVIHSLGSWGISGSNASDVPFYARWVQNANSHWVVETLVSPFDFESLTGTFRTQDDVLFEQISNRSASLSEAYNSGNHSRLQSFYMDHAVIVPQGDRPFEKTDIPSKKSFIGQNVRLETKIVTKAPGSEAVHEVGFSDSTGAGYLARWVQNVDAEWVIEAHVFAIFPKAKASAVATQIIV